MIFTFRGAGGGGARDGFMFSRKERLNNNSRLES
jgi:hypothetical protein